MVEKVQSGRFRWRLTTAFVLVTAICTGLLGAVYFLLARSYRMETFGRRSLKEARLDIAIAQQRLGEHPRASEVDALFSLYRRAGDFDTVLLSGGRAFSSDTAITEADVPRSVRDRSRSEQAIMSRHRIGQVPYLVAGGSIGRRTQIYFFFSMADIARSLTDLTTILVTGWAAVVPLAGFVGALVARQTLRPVARASKAARALAEGLMETRLPVEADDEFGLWALSFNEMAQALQDKITALARAHERERRFASDVAHELRTPLTALVSEAELLEQELERMPPAARRPAKLLVEDVTRLRRLVNELLELLRLEAGRDALERQTVQLDGLVRQLIRSRKWEPLVRLETEEVIVSTDPRRVERIVANLVENAVEHGRSAARVRVGRDGVHAAVEIVDSGPGIPPEHLPHIFERFYKADPSRADTGTGLGLSIALDNARSVGGDIEVDSRPGIGTRFLLTLPRT